MRLVSEIWPYLLLVFVGFLPNEIWRMLGILVSRGLDEDSEILVWVRAVANAILTGVVAKIVLFAPGALSSVPVGVRIAATAFGVLVFWQFGGSVLVGVASGTVALVIGALAFGG